MNELVGMCCSVDYALESWRLPSCGDSVYVEAVDMPMLKLRNMHTMQPTNGIWVNCSIIKTIKPNGFILRIPVRRRRFWRWS